MLIRLHKQAKDLLRRSGLGDAMLHLNGGLLIFLAAALVAPGGLASPWPLALVATVELANEAGDRLRTGGWNARDTLADIALTLIWPVLFHLAARYALI